MTLKLSCFWRRLSLAIIWLIALLRVHIIILSLEAHWPAQIEDTLVLFSTRLARLAIQIDCKLLISLNIKALVHLCHHFHPGGLQTSSLIWIRILVHLRGLLSVHVLSIDGDPTIMLAKKAIGDIIWWTWWHLSSYWCALLFIILFLHWEIRLIIWTFLLFISWSSSWYFYVEVIWHWKLPFVTVKCGPIFTRLSLPSFNICKDFGARLELRLVLRHIKLSLVNASALRLSSAWSAIRCRSKRLKTLVYLEPGPGRCWFQTYSVFLSHLWLRW